VGLKLGFFTVKGYPEEPGTGMDPHDWCELGDKNLLALKTGGDAPLEFLGFIAGISVHDRRVEHFAPGGFFNKF
jgi:hypothetical protein